MKTFIALLLFADLAFAQAFGEADIAEKDEDEAEEVSALDAIKDAVFTE